MPRKETLALALGGQKKPPQRGFPASIAFTNGRLAADRRVLTGTSSGGRRGPSSSGSRHKDRDASQVRNRPRLA